MQKVRALSTDFTSRDVGAGIVGVLDECAGVESATTASVANGAAGSPVVYVMRRTPILAKARKHAAHGREYAKPGELRRTRTTTTWREDANAPRFNFHAASISA